ncbi:purine nucleoside phosphorylase YfiH [Methylosoma difficile]
MTDDTLFLRPDWPVPEGIHAATSLRRGGFSKPPFASLNPAMHVGDQPEHVLQNRQIIANGLNLPSEPCWLTQTHSNIAVEAGGGPLLPQADASFTCQSGVVCAVLTADCLPVLVCAKNGSAIAAIHAGWRGLHEGIVSNTLTAMPKQDYWVWLGPAIGRTCFEVGDDVREAFLDKSAINANAFQSTTAGKWLADIYQLARNELHDLGIGQVFGGGLCTVTDAERFYSYRRDKETGRMATLIWSTQ